MKIAYSHLLKFFKEEPPIEEISNHLFQLGHENEIEGDILDIEFTPNRGDCLSLLGIARDLGVFYTLVKPQTYYEDKLEKLEINFKNNSAEDCPNISFLSIEVDEIPDLYEDYLESYFTTFKINKNNFFTDISNYVAYEIGQPTHCYDILSIDNEIEFTSENLNENFETLLNKNIILSGSNCVFKSNNEVINLAGVMGSKSTACSEETKKVLIECAYFKPESIIGKAQKYNLHSDASYKFERGVDPSMLEKAIRRFIKIVSDHTKIVDFKYANFQSKDLPLKKIKYDLQKIQNIIGTEIQDKIYKDFLIKIGFEVTNDQILIPHFRHDISCQNDLAEEMARIIGYDNIKPSDFKITKKKKSKKSCNEDSLRYFLASCGFNEVINMPFSCRDSDAIEIDNPLDSNRSFFRTTIQNSLIDNLLYNEKRQKESIKLFEISDIYYVDKNNEVVCDKYLGIIVSGRVGNNYREFSQKLDSQYLQKILKLDQNQIFEISRGGLNTKIKNKIFMVLLKLNELPKNFINIENQKIGKINFNTYNPISDFPSSTRDFSFAIKDSNMIKELELVLSKINVNFLKDFFIFDYY